MCSFDSVDTCNLTYLNVWLLDKDMDVTIPQNDKYNGSILYWSLFPFLYIWNWTYSYFISMENVYIYNVHNCGCSAFVLKMVTIEGVCLFSLTVFLGYCKTVVLDQLIVYS